MLIFIVRRLLSLIPVIWGIATIVFALMYLVPGDPARLMAGQYASEQTIEAIRAKMGLDRPVHERYGLFLASL